MDDVQLRPATQLDDDFLGTLYAASRAEEIAASGWSDEVAHLFLTGQRAAQETHYRATYPSARHDIIVMGNRPIGRLWVDRGHQRILLIDILLLADWRGRGIGRGLITGLITEACAQGSFVELSVSTDNIAAQRLYARLGFGNVGSSPTHHHLRCTPNL